MAVHRQLGAAEADPEEIFESWLGDGDYATCLHSFRETVLDEFDAVLELGYDDAARITEQLIHYAELRPAVLDQHPYWNGMFARRNAPAVHEMTDRWFDHVLRYSRRDQLSANFVFSEASIDLRVVDEDTNDSVSHQWPAGVGRKTHKTLASRKRSGPLLAEIRRLRLEIAELKRVLADARLVEDAKLRAYIQELESKLVYARSRHAAAVRIFGPRTVAFASRVRTAVRRIVSPGRDSRQK
ncbi:hypothetical protein ET445_15840 [Agromyces protaetiae]|uniref:Uncharacterized protein n=1 Tax=Agromyces protaetiae TaxID=2509455 RepID=A0A4P6FFE1_9MICO|nr:hypothetical protein [Agromyces protaetiae]QAY74586.1 hypothetical protein ET445_15840 [Agromyces protaetiae]